jgi:c-di-GMP-related signal transduction protein
LKKMDVFVARQPIINRHRELYAYRLLHLQTLPNAVDGTDAVTATIQVISNTLLAIGIESLLCGKKALITFDSP